MKFHKHIINILGCSNVILCDFAMHLFTISMSPSFHGSRLLREHVQGNRKTTEVDVPGDLASGVGCHLVNKN